MKALFLSLIIASTLVSAQDKTESVKIIKIDAVCGNAENLLKMVTKFEERPLLTMVSKRASDDKTYEYETVLFVNSKTQSYTLVEQISPTIYCVTSTGDSLLPYIK